jgi:hypothetical protein
MLVLAAGALAGCGGRSVTGTLIVDTAGRQWTTRVHVKDVADPFAASPPPALVMRGEPGGGEGEPTANKMTFASRGGFFQMPATGECELVLRVAAVRLTKLRVVVSGRDPDGYKTYRIELPAEGRWCELAIPLNRERNLPGSTVDDITLFQSGADKAARLYLDSIRLRTAPAPPQQGSPR